MLLVKVAPIFLLALATAEKKIELQDIEEDNLRSEKQKQYEKTEGRPQGTSGTAPDYVPLDYLKNNFIQYFEPTPVPQQHRYVHQYSVTEHPERSPVTPKPEYGPPTAQQAMVGYLSNVPMQVYLVPQYYNEPTQQAAHAHAGVQLPAPAIGPVSYHQETQNVHQQSGYLEVPTYVTPTTKAYLQPYTPPVAYVSYAQPTLASNQAAVTPVLAYQMPVVQYPTAISAPPPKGYYQSPQYVEANSVDENQGNEISIQKPYPSHNEIPTKPTDSGYPRYYNSRTPVGDDYNRSPIQLPNPHPLLLKGTPGHLAHIPKALPMYRPLSKPVYTTGGGFIASAFTPRPSENFQIPFKRRPTSLLDSYIPSSIQIEYLKRGLTKDPLSAYEALASGRHLSQTSQSPFIPRYYERGFLPNQMYHTAAGGITYGHHKRASKLEKAQK